MKQTAAEAVNLNGIPPPDPRVSAFQSLTATPEQKVEAFSAIASDFIPLLNGFFARRLDASPHRGPEDATQETLVKVWQGLDRFTSRSKLSTWIFRIAANYAVDDQRMQGRRPSIVRGTTDEHQASIDNEAEVTRQGDLPNDIDRKAEVDLILAKINELPKELREAVLLREVQGLAYREIASHLGISMATVKWRLHTAREKIAASAEDTEYSQEKSPRQLGQVTIQPQAQAA